MLYAVALLVRAAIRYPPVIVWAFAGKQSVLRLAQLVHAPYVYRVTSETVLGEVRIEVVNVVEDMPRWGR